MRIYEIAKLAGVSITTVSRVINKNRGVKRENKQRVLEVIKRHNYEPNPYARYLAFRKNGKLAGSQD
jgi:DNA-binding LacI/PurR family transcriptional regulator